MPFARSTCPYSPLDSFPSAARNASAENFVLMFVAAFAVMTVVVPMFVAAFAVMMMFVPMFVPTAVHFLFEPLHVVR